MGRSAMAALMAMAMAAAVLGQSHKHTSYNWQVYGMEWYSTVCRVLRRVKQ